MAKVPTDDKRSTDPVRNAQGRFRRGHTGNPKGRPRKDPIRYSVADTLVLANTLVDLKTADGRRQTMTRREVNHLRLFEAANKGDVRAQIYLDRKFEKMDELHNGIRAKLHDTEMEWIFNRWGKDDGGKKRSFQGLLMDMPADVKSWMLQAYHVLGLKPIWEVTVDDPRPYQELRKKYPDVFDDEDAPDWKKIEPLLALVGGSSARFNLALLEKTIEKIMEGSKEPAKAVAVKEETKDEF